MLEVGSGLTGMASFIRNDSFRVIRVDTRIRKIETAVGLTKDKLRADARVLPFKDRAFECVVAVDMIEHVPKRRGLSSSQS